MTAPPTRDQLAPHVDHDVSQFLLLHRELHRFRYCLYPETVRRAIVVAYATHFRALLEFFHDKRPLPAEMAAAGCEAKDDITYSSFAGAVRPIWTIAERKRLCDADKLAGHLSKGRVDREGAYPPWGTPADLDLLRDHIRALLALDVTSSLKRSHPALTQIS